MNRPSVFDLELADLIQDEILRDRRAKGESTSFTDDEYNLLVEYEVGRTRIAFSKMPRSSRGQDTGFSTRQQEFDSPTGHK